METSTDFRSQTNGTESQHYNEEEEIISEKNEIISIKSYAEDNCQSTTATTSSIEETQNMRTNKTISYVLRKDDPNEHTRIVRGEFHQSDERFQEMSRGKQYIAISVVVLCFFKHKNNPETWTTADINQILINGDIQYYASYKKMKREVRVSQTPHLSLSDIYPYIRIGRKYFCLNETDDADTETNVLKRNNLEASLNRFFIDNQNVCGIFTCNFFSFAIMRKSNSFFLFNSRATSYDGELIDPCDKQSAACLMEMFTETCLASYLMLACDQRHMTVGETAYNPGVSYSITSVNVDKKVFGRGNSIRKKVIRDLGMAESKGRHIERKRKSTITENAHGKFKRKLLHSENTQKEAKNDLKVGVGMVNLGNSCYLNATLQALFNIYDFAEWLISEWIHDCDTKSNHKKVCLVCAMVYVLKISKSSSRAIEPKQVYCKLKEINPKLTLGAQNDAHEFLKSLLQSMDQSGTNDKVSDIFYGIMLSTVTCLVCKTKTEASEAFTEIVLNVENVHSVEDALKLYFNVDYIEEFDCLTCKKYVNATRQFSILQAPTTLCVVLNRFPDQFRKIQDPKKISPEMKLCEYGSDILLSIMTYRVNSVISHIGKAQSSGHYTTIAVKKRNSNELYYEFDDKSVKKVEFTDISTANAYMILYEMQPDPGHPINSQEKETMPSNMIDEEENYTTTSNKFISDQQHNKIKENYNETEEVRDESENSNKENNMPSGLRIVDVPFLMGQMKYINQHYECCSSNLVLQKETKLGFRSIFHFECADCGISHQLQSSSNNFDNMSVNKAATLGITSIGSGFYHLQELFANLNIPCMSSTTFEKENKEIQKEWSNLAKHHVEQALLEEIRHAVATGNVDSAGNVLITVICDGSWGKRSYGKGFSSLSGCAAIIGLHTKKVIYFGVKNKYCHTCTLSYAQFCPPNTHICNISYVGPSSGMETEILVEGFKFCQSLGARFHKIIADGDSSAFKEISEQCVYQNPDIVIEKIECVNHLYKNARKKLTALCTDTHFQIGYRKLLKHSIGDDLCKGIRCAANYWRESNVEMTQKLDNLEKDCLNAPYHYFGNHDNCNKYFCNKSTTDGSNAKITLLKSCGIFHEILNYCNIYFASNVTSLLEDETNNAAEELNNVIAKYLGGKRINYSLAGSYTGRVSAAVVQYNSKGHAGSEFHKFHNKKTNNDCLKIEYDRIRHYSENEKARQSKPRVRSIKDKVAKGYKGQKEDLSEGALKAAMAIELDKIDTNRVNRDLILASTFGQKYNHKWKETRKKLINCNYFGRIINARGPKSYQKLLEEILYTPIEWSNTAETRHQRLYEHEALKMFKLVHKYYELEKTGVFIDAELGFLGASPLRLFGPDCIVNVQCPLKAFKKTVDFAIAKSLVPLTYEDGEILVKETSNWYIEVQGQLHITGRYFCYLIVWLGTEFAIKKIAVDHTFWENKMKNKLQYFFSEAMIKELANSRRRRKMDLRKYDSQTNTFV